MNQYKNSLKDKKILIVDDSPSVRKLVLTIFSHQGSDVIQAAEGGKALKCLCDCGPGAILPDIVLIDLHMPGMDGLTLYKKIKECEECNSTPIIIFSSDHKKLYEIYKDPFEADELLRKPFTAKELLDKAIKALCC